MPVKKARAARKEQPEKMGKTPPQNHPWRRDGKAKLRPGTLKSYANAWRDLGTSLGARALADIAGGYAALTVAPEGMEVTTVEYKINFLAALQGGSLRANGQVVRAGKRIIVTSATVVHWSEQGQCTDCAVMQQTLVPVAKTY